MKKLSTYIPLLLGLAVALGVFLGAKLNFQDAKDPIFAKNSKKDKLNRLIDYIDYEYVDSVNTDSIVDVTVNGILKHLDPHSVYISKKHYAAVAEDMRGNFVGIGVSFYMYNDTVSVISTIEGSPAEKAGIIAGDRIIYANGKPLYGVHNQRDSVTSSLRGALNSQISITVFRSSENKTLQFNLKRKEIPLKSVDAAFTMNDHLGYIKINRFAESTVDEFKEALQNLILQNITSLIIDLRDNPGGYVHAAEQMLDEFLPKGTLLLKTKNKAGIIEKSVATKKGIFEEGQVYVLVNENSASASEIFAGALQDNDKGTIIGRRTYGKGLVQREMNLGDGSAVRLTVARYYTPTGRSIQRPYENGNKSYFNEKMQRYQNGELFEVDSIVPNDSLRFVTPKGKVVYGGGGIIPDVFIAKDPSDENEIINYLSKSGVLNYFVFEQLDKNRNFYKKFDPQAFYNKYEVSPELFVDFIAYATLNEINFDLQNYEYLLKLQLKATMAQQLFGGNYFEKISTQHDVMIEKVMELERRQ